MLLLKYHLPRLYDLYQIVIRKQYNPGLGKRSLRWWQALSRSPEVPVTCATVCPAGFQPIQLRPAEPQGGAFMRPLWSELWLFPASLAQQVAQAPSLPFLTIFHHLLLHHPSCRCTRNVPGLPVPDQIPVGRSQPPTPQPWLSVCLSLRLYQQITTC